MNAAVRAWTPEPDLELGIAEERLLPASAPAEVRGDGRDDVRLLLQERGSGRFAHRHFRDLPEILAPGDLLVVNRSATVPASLPAQDDAGRFMRLHVAQRLGPGIYRVEGRSADGLRPAARVPAAGERLAVVDGRGGRLDLKVLDRASSMSRQVVVATQGRRSLGPWQMEIGQPIRYAYVPRRWSIEFYQTVFAGPPGSAEMPSAARPFTTGTLAALRRRGVRIAFLTLHCGLSSEEVEGSLAEHYLPPEPYRLPAGTVQDIMRARARGGRVIAVGTTVVRALVSASREGRLAAGHGLADAVVRPGVDVQMIDGLLTGLHAPRSSHLALLETFAPPEHLRGAYEAALAQGYLWHEFGDVHLILPGVQTA